MQSYVYYHGRLPKVMYSNIFLHDVLRSNTSVEVIYGDNKRKQNPDDERLQLKSNGRVSVLRLIRTEFLTWITAG